MPRPGRCATASTRPASCTAPIGRANFEVEALKDNLLALLADLQKAKPAASKGIYLKRVTVSSTMGPGIAVDQASLGL